MANAFTHTTIPASSWVRARRFRACAGTTIVEALVAAGLIVIAFTGLFQVSVRSMRMLKVQSEIAQATEAIQERIDSLRDQSWGTITNSVNFTTYNYTLTDAGVSTTQTWTGIMNALPTAAGQLNNPVETVTISAYPSTGSSPAPFTVKNTNGTVTMTPLAGSDLSGLTMIRVDTKLEWNEAGSGRARSYETAFIITKKGVGK